MAEGPRREATGLGVTLERRSLAQLHELAAERGVPRFRAMRREELLAALGSEVPSAGSQLDRLQGWYARQCDGEWEYRHGVSIRTLDRPGWTVAIDLEDTDVSPRGIPAREERRTEHDWIICRVEGAIFAGAGGPENLDEVLAYFLDRAGG